MMPRVGLRRNCPFSSIGNCAKLLIVDLTRAEFVSVVGVEVIRDTQRVLADRGGRLRVEHASRQVQHLLSLSGADVELC